MEVSLYNINISDLPPPVILNHTRSNWWVWLDWRLPAIKPFSYSVTNFTLCYSPPEPNATLQKGMMCPPLPPLSPSSPCACSSLVGGQRFENVTDLEGNTVYVFSLRYFSSKGFFSSWSVPLSVETLGKPFKIRC